MPGRLLFLVAFLVASAGCGSKSSITMTGTSVPRSYNGTASVGDFLNITLDPAAQTLLYTNLSNGDSGTVPYTVNNDGTYTLNDPHGNLIAAYEVPNYALIVQAAKTGPNHDMPALVTAVQKSTISVATWAGKEYNYMQFRTSSGGVEVGSAIVDAHGSVANSSYWPFGAMDPNSSAFNEGGFDVNMFQSDPSGSFLKLADDNDTFDYVFGTPNGVFAVDTPNGAILGLKKAASKDFDPSSAGTYQAIYYLKTGATMGPQNMEAGTPSLGKATLVVSPLGHVTMRDAQGNTMVDSTLTPVADTGYLYGGPGLLGDPCHGVFTVRVTTASSRQDVFLAFMDKALMFASLQSGLPWQSGNPYDYFYGVGLK